MQVIYNIKNLSNGKIYIGSTIHFKQRRTQHFSFLRNNSHPNKHLQAAYNKYPNSFIMEVVEEVQSTDYQVLLEVEQRHIDGADRIMLYNKAFDVTAGGYEERMIPVYLLNLKGVTLYEFKSIQALSRFLNPDARQSILGKNINTKSISKCNKGFKYRIVTPDFYTTNIEIINNWKPYACKTTYKYNFITKYVMYNDDESSIFNSKRACASRIGVSCERIRQLVVGKVLHKKSGFYIKQIIVDTNIY